jgi:signal transduction histidine kinase/CheY-like chemotaxis protein
MFLHQIILMLLLLLMRIVVASPDLEPHDTKHHLLVLLSYHEGMPWQRTFLNGFKQFFEHQDTELYIEQLDTARFHELDYAETFQKMILQKYQHIKLDLIITESTPAATLVSRLDQIQPQALRLYVNDRENRNLFNYAGKKINKITLPLIDYLAVVNIAVQLVQAQTLYVISEASSKDSYATLNDFNEAIKLYRGKVKIEYLDLPMNELKERVSHLPPSSAILFLLKFKDENGLPTTPYQVVQTLSQYTAVPIFSYWSSLMGSGVVGGKMIVGEKVGKWVAEQAIQLLKGGTILSSDDIYQHVFAFQFDWRQLQRFHLNQQRLPKDSEIFYREPTFIEQHKGPLVVSAIIIIVLFLMVIFLNREVAKRTQALKKQNADLINARNQADLANHAKSQFLANMSHELRTPLNAILGYTQILERNTTVPNEVQEKISIIEHSGEHLLTLINDILDLSKIEAGKLELQPTEVNLPTFFKEVVHLFEWRAQQKGLEFIYEHHLASAVSCCQGFPDIIMADAKRLRQILLNLLSNAVKFTEKGQVILSVTYLPKTMLVEVKDSGRGIAPADMDTIFEPFRQVGDQQQIEGTGLGLPICRKLVALMDGELKVSSILGQGSVFSLEIPLAVVQWTAQSHAQSTIAAQRQISGYQGPRRKILVVDDVMANRTLLVDFFKQLGFILAEASDGLEALRIAPNFQPDIVFMDVRMPHLDGLETTRQLRAMAGFADTVIFIMSASVFQEQKQHAMSVGGNAFLNKPIALDEMLAAMTEHSHILWIEKVASQSSTVPSNTLVPPSPEILAILREMLRRGEVLPARKLLENLQEPAWTRFRDEALKLAKQFKMKELKAFVNGFSA